MSRIISTALAIVVSIIVVCGYKWWAYVHNTESPYDEIGITLNSNAPEPIRAMGCASLKSNFPRAVPPYGCAAPGGGWR